MASWNLLLEEIIDLCESAVLRLWEEEVDPDSPDSAQTKVEETGFGTPVPGVSGVVQHTRVELANNDLTDNVDGTTEDDGLSSGSV